MVRVSAIDPKLKRDYPTEDGGDTVFIHEGDLTQPAKDDHVSKRRIIRSKYRQIESRINEEKDEIANATSDKFLAILKEVESMHQEVKKPREQVADAEALLGLTRSLVASVKIHTNGGLTPAEFISCVIKKFGQQKKMNGLNGAANIMWQDIGSDVSHAFMSATGCNTMIGPMKSEIKIRKVSVRAKRTKPIGRDHPKELDKIIKAEIDTDKNVRLMFEMLRKKRKVKLENLILNRTCFAQTVENLFAMSFLVKDGRVSIKVDENGSQIVVPSNGPSAAQIKSGAAESYQFMFRFDHTDWKLMKARVVEGEELMPRRDVNADGSLVQEKGGPLGIDLRRVKVIPVISQKQNATAPVRKFSQNHGHVLRSKVEPTETGNGTVPSWNCKRKRSKL